MASILSITDASGAEQTVAEWTLGELVEAALDRNPGLAAARARASAAEEDIAAARGARLPSVDGVILGEGFPRNERLLIFRHGSRGDDNPFENAIVNYGVEVRLPLYTSGRIKQGVSLAQARAEAARIRIDGTRNALIFNIASAYYTGLRLQRVIVAQTASLASLNESLRIAALQEDVGRLAPLDKTRIETRLARAESDLVAAKNAFAQTLEILKELVNLPLGERLAIGGELRAAAMTVARAELQREAQANRPDLVALRRDVAAKRAEVGIAKSSFGPEVNLTGSYRGVTGLDDGITKDDAIVLLELRVPLFSGGVLGARRRKALAELREAELRLEAGERRVLTEVERATLDLEAAGARITAGERAGEQAEESLRVEREKFAQGRGTSNDLLLAEEALLRARFALAGALADSQIARAAIILAVGENPTGAGVAAGGPQGNER